MSLFLDGGGGGEGGLTTRSAQSETSIGGGDNEVLSSGREAGGGINRGEYIHSSGSGNGLQGLLRQSRRKTKTALSVPWERARRVRKPVANDNTWWRDEFKALWEMRCAIPSFEALKRANTGIDDNS